MSKALQHFQTDTDGSTAIEYSLIAAFVALVIITALTAIGVELTGIFSDVDAGLKTRA
ncbi:MAG: Flp family type IVb pilin [Pseudomonadota bacterium]